jgi:DnaJ-class molecular chaperone
MIKEKMRMTKCWRCEGRGQIRHPHHVEEMVECPTCDGTGKELSNEEIEQIRESRTYGN